MKRHFILLKVSGLEPHHQIILCPLQDACAEMQLVYFTALADWVWLTGVCLADGPTLQTRPMYILYIPTNWGLLIVYLFYSPYFLHYLDLFRLLLLLDFDPSKIIFFFLVFSWPCLIIGFSLVLCVFVFLWLWFLGIFFLMSRDIWIEMWVWFYHFFSFFFLSVIG